VDGRNESGHDDISELRSSTVGIISDLEAIVLKGMAVQNANDSNFTIGKKWDQIKLGEVDKYLNRLCFHRAGRISAA
jgi:hypothetical protein